MNAILICYCNSELFELCYIFGELVNCFYDFVLHSGEET
jgi:hypothetical protein